MSIASLLKKYRSQHDPQKAEVLARITLASFLAYVLSIAYLPRIVPPSQTFMLGLIGSSMAIAVPQLVMTVFLIIPSMLVNAIVALLGMSAILAGATVSNGVSVAVFAVYTFWITSLYFGPDFDKTGSNATGLTSITGLLALSYRTLVQNGVSATVDNPMLPEALESIAEILSALCVQIGQEPNCWEEALPDLTQPIAVTLPDDVENFGGQTAYITPNMQDSSLRIDIPGGLWIVKGLWTWSGTTNSLAGNRNFLIAACWGLACVAVAILLPPFRTARGALARGLVPKSIAEAASTKISSEDGDCSDESTAQIQKVTHFYNSLKPSTASVTLFEPRICTAPFEYTVPKLSELIRCTRRATLGKLTMAAWKHVDNSEIEAVDKVLRECSDTLLSYDDDHLSRLGQMKDAERDSDQSLLRDSGAYMHVTCDKLLDATVQWVSCQIHPDSPSPCRKEGFSNLRKICSAWVSSPFLNLKRMGSATLLPFKPKSWDWRSIAWSLKYTLGLVALYILSVYADGYANLSLTTGHSSIETGAVFSGWNLLGYAFSWTPTFEGTVKKGTMRMLGTCIGGFSAWLGILICSGNDETNINPYGLIAWMTVFTCIFASFGVEPSVAARLGMSKDHGAELMYAVMTLALICIETYAGKGSSGDLTLNRVVATLTGVAMCMLVSSIPPVVKGSSPDHAQLFLNALKDTFRSLLEQLVMERLNAAINAASLQSLLDDAATQQRVSFYLLNDASKLRRLPILRVDERLKPLLEEMTVTESLVSQLADVETAMFEADASLTSEFAVGTSARTELQQILESLDDSTNDKAEDAEEPRASSVSEKDDAADSQSKARKIFVPLVQIINNRIHEHESILKSMSA